MKFEKNLNFSASVQAAQMPPSSKIAQDDKKDNGEFNVAMSNAIESAKKQTADNKPQETSASGEPAKDSSKVNDGEVLVIKEVRVGIPENEDTSPKQLIIEDADLSEAEQPEVEEIVPVKLAKTEPNVKPETDSKISFDFSLLSKLKNLFAKKEEPSKEPEVLVDRGGGDANVVLTPIAVAAIEPKPGEVIVEKEVKQQAPSVRFNVNQGSFAIAPSAERIKVSELKVDTKADVKKEKGEFDIMKNDFIRNVNPNYGADASSLLNAGKLSGKALEEFMTTVGRNSQGKGIEQAVQNVVANNTPALAYAPPFNPNPTSPNVTSQLGTDRWNREIGQKVVWMLGGQDKSATLTLNPPELGPLQVVISVNNEKADARFFSNNPEVRVALENGMETLRDMMKSSGVELGNTDVRDGGSQQSSNGKNQSQQRGFYQNAEADIAIPEQSASVRVTDGIVNTFA